MEGPTLENVHALLSETRETIVRHIEHEDSMPGKLDVLTNRVDAIEAGLRVVAAGHVSLNSQMAEVTTSLQIHHADIRHMREEISANTRTTDATLKAAHELKDIMTTATMLGRFARYIGPTVVAIAAALAVAAGWLNAVGDLAARAVHTITGGPRP